MGGLDEKKVQKKFVDTLKFAKTLPITVMREAEGPQKNVRTTLKFSKALT